MLQRHIYKDLIVQARIARDRMSAMIHVIRAQEDREIVLAGPFTSLDLAMQWIDNSAKQAP